MIVPNNIRDSNMTQYKYTHSNRFRHAYNKEITLVQY